ncbi:hypothetical protein BSKO_05971 [Bryopsis sp. KO-2023]|nr:hypothetical protein BSKO_05971 [Bryopsis sp. KO-2023]
MKGVASMRGGSTFFRGVRLPVRPCRIQAPSRRGGLVIRAGSITTADFKTGLTLEIDGSPWRVVEFLHVKPGKGAAFVRSKLKNCIAGTVVEKTFRAGESLISAEVRKKESQYTYADGSDYVFMDLSSYEETRVAEDESWAKYLKEGMDVYLVVWNDKVISVDIPATVELVIAQTDPIIKSNTASGGSTKLATLETGAIISVPLFIGTGEKIKVDTKNDQYLSRVT